MLAPKANLSPSTPIPIYCQKTNNKTSWEIRPKPMSIKNEPILRKPQKIMGIMMRAKRGNIYIYCTARSKQKKSFLVLIVVRSIIRIFISAHLMRHIV